jgi:hypothetical protein
MPTEMSFSDITAVGGPRAHIAELLKGSIIGLNDLAGVMANPHLPPFDVTITKEIRLNDVRVAYIWIAIKQTIATAVIIS